MILDRDQVRVIPPEYRLFEHIAASVDLECEHPEALNSLSIVRVRLSIGPFAQPPLIEGYTDYFLLGLVPGVDVVWRALNRVRDTGIFKDLDFWTAVISYLEHAASGFLLEFPVENGAISSFRVNLGRLPISGSLPQPFPFLEYFGETSRLED